MQGDIYDDVQPVGGGTASTGTGGAPATAAPSSQPNGQAGTPQPAAAKEAISDADFASFTDDVQEVDPNASTADAPPPVALGYHAIKLTILKDHQTLPWGTSRLPGKAKVEGKVLKSISIGTEAVVCEAGSEFDKRFLRRLYISTALLGNISWADEIVKAANGGKLPYGEKRDNKTAWAAAAKALQNGLVCGAEVDWQLSPEGKNAEGEYDKDFLRSAHGSSWPKDSQGNPKVLDADPVSKKPARTQAFVKRVFPLNQLPQLRQLAKSQAQGKAGAAGGAQGSGSGSQGAGSSVPAPVMVD